jgi:pseudaminic acid synthase
MDTVAPVVAVTLGAKVIEKHFILDRALGGVDSDFSLEPAEFAKMVEQVRQTEQMLGSINYELTPKTIKSREFARSLFVAEDIAIGEVFTTKNIRSVRPGFGLHPKHLDEIVGKKASKNIKKGKPLDWSMIG